MTSGFTCALGEFHPIPIEEVEALKELQEEGRQRDAIEVEPAELPEDEAAEPNGGCSRGSRRGLSLSVRAAQGRMNGSGLPFTLSVPFAKRKRVE